MASGPDFKSGLYDTLPTSNVDIAPTVARILEFSMPAVQGRVLEEALQGGPPVSEYAVLNKTHRSSTKTGLTMKLPTDLDGRSVDPNLTRYSVELKTKILTRGGGELHLLRSGQSRPRMNFRRAELQRGRPCQLWHIVAPRWRRSCAWRDDPTPRSLPAAAGQGLVLWHGDCRIGSEHGNSQPAVNGRIREDPAQGHRRMGSWGLGHTGLEAM